MNQNNDIVFRDISNELFILNKYTIDTLFSLDNGADCIALYVFYYKTAKWQETNIIKANDDYIKKSLKWGTDRIQKTKNILKENGLIKTIKRVKENGVIEGWYIEISYLVSDEKSKEIHDTQKPQVVVATSGNEETNALKYKIKMLEDKIKMLEEENNKIKSITNFQDEKEEKGIESKEKEKILRIFTWWNVKNIIKHSKLNETRIKAIKNKLKDYNVSEIEKAISNYATVLHDNSYYWNYTWSLEDFLNRKNGFTTFLDEGSNWVNYQKQKGEISRETAYPEFDDVGYIR